MKNTATPRSRERNDSPIERIERTTIPDHVSALLDEYDDAVGERDRFLWRWLYFLFPEIRLSCVSPEAGDEVRDAKLLASLYVVLLDDLAEIVKDKRTLEEAAKIPFSHQDPDDTRPGVDARFVELGARVWENVETAIASSPRSDEFREILLFDLEQTLDAIEYSYLTNEHLDLASLEETTIYDSHNMMLFAYADLDLMHSPSFDRDELGALRKVVRRAQRMARIGNWVTTWERELGEGDFSSGVVVSALENDVVSEKQLVRLCDGHAPEKRGEVVTRIREAGIEERFVQRWTDHYAEIDAHRSELRTIDVDSILAGMDTVLECHFASRGLK